MLEGERRHTGEKKMTDFVYILHVDFETALTTMTKRISFLDRNEAEKFRLGGDKRGYKIGRAHV